MSESWQEAFAGLLPQVERPIRYTDSELNARKKTGNCDVRVVFVFPDTYEIGMSNYGLRVLYHIVNGMEKACAERAFIPWIDMLENMKAQGIPLHSLETRTPLREFDMVGITLQSELGYTNALACMELSGIPLRSVDRDSSHPIMIAGGPCTVNPLPLSVFFDAFLVGDGEDAIREIANLFIAEEDRKDRICGLAGIRGVWVPSIHGKKKSIKRRYVPQLKMEDAPVDQIVSIGEVEHDRLVVEIGRGCLRGCRFCQAGFTNRPLRYRSAEDILDLSRKGISLTGWEEVSLLSFAVSDYPDLDSLLSSLNTELKPTRTGISLPSFRGEAFNEQVALRLREIKKTGLTFAPETASPRLKRIINKQIPNEEIIETARLAAKLGWRRVKLYMMIGFPGEIPEDIDMNIEFIRELARSVKGLMINVHIASFIPKPHTPFQWTVFADLVSLSEIIERFREEIGIRRVKVKWARPESSFIEAILARGDERLTGVLEGVLQRGGYFQEWSEHFQFEIWKQVFDAEGIDPLSYTAARNPEQPLPWDFIDTGISKDFLLDEYQRIQAAELHADCMHGQCYDCGMECASMPSEPVKTSSSQPGTSKRISNRISNSLSSQVTPLKYRIKVAIGEQFRFASHLDMVRAIYRALRRSQLDIAYTEGFSPHPRVRFGFPKPVGVASKGEYFDISLASRPHGGLNDILSAAMPEGMEVVASRALGTDTAAITKAADILHYEVSPVPEISAGELKMLSTEIQNIYHVTAENSILDIMVENAQRVKLWDVLASLYHTTPQDARSLSVTRIETYLRVGTRLVTPLEENFR